MAASATPAPSASSPSSAAGRRSRRAGAGDVEALVALRRLMFEAMGSDGADEPVWQEAARQWFAERLDAVDTCLVVVEVEGTVVASAMGTRRDAAPSPSAVRSGDVLISNVATDPHHRRRGHARAAVLSVLEWARTLGVGRAELLATAEGQQLYLDAGFVPSPHPVLRCALGD